MRETDRYRGLRVTVMGLGLHGGGLATAQFLHRQGARVTVTDLRTPEVLEPTVRLLPEGIHLVLGEHREEDFREADLVVKNPAVPRNARWLWLEPLRTVTTDIALFLSGWSDRLGVERGPLVVVTGTKGKSSTAGAVAALLKESFPGTQLGGNITVSPLRFLEDLGPRDPVVLELSSFQLGDLRFCQELGATTLHLRADVAIMTSIFPDHQDYYDSMDAYVRDKEEIFASLAPGALCVLGAAPEWNRRFETLIRTVAASVAASTGASTSAAAVRTLEQDAPFEREAELLPPTLTVAGAHMRRNVYMAALAAEHLGVPRERIRAAAGTFSGVPHRLERVGERQGIEIVNDTAATIPEAALAAVQAYSNRVLLIAGGSDKGLDLAPLVQAGVEADGRGGAMILLAGSATDRLLPLLREAGVPVHGPASSLRESFLQALALTREDRTEQTTILLSPGCASFGMFRNEFDRGDQFRALAQAFLESG